MDESQRRVQSYREMLRKWNVPNHIRDNYQSQDDEKHKAKIVWNMDP